MAETGRYLYATWDWRLFLERPGAQLKFELLRVYLALFDSLGVIWHNLIWGQEDGPSFVVHSK